MKKIYGWVIVDKQLRTVDMDLFFSTPTRCREILGWWDEERFQIVELYVEEGFNDLDYIPENY